MWDEDGDTRHEMIEIIYLVHFISIDFEILYLYES
jgi:hypothetical protein